MKIKRILLFCILIVCSSLLTLICDAPGLSIANILWVAGLCATFLEEE